jgi:NADH-quinone oxidoreductase subunit G
MADSAAALRAVHEAGFVVALSPFQHRALEYADVMLPMAPFTETAGTFVNAEGRVQSFKGVVQPLAETRPGWKILRVLGNLLELPGFSQDSSDEVKAQALAAAGELTAALDNGLRSGVVPAPAAAPAGLQRIADVPIHFADGLARRSPPLQHTADAESPRASMNRRTAAELEVGDGDQVRLAQGQGAVMLFAHLDDRIPDGCVRVPAAHPLSVGLGLAGGELGLERMGQTTRASA